MEPPNVPFPGNGNAASGEPFNGGSPHVDRTGPDSGWPIGTEEHSSEEEQLVRPFVITGGRTKHERVHLRVESLVVVTDAGPTGSLQFEHAQIVELCQAPISVAEVAARLKVPLGVAQILVGDLADVGIVKVHEATSIATPALLLRMIDAVRAL